LPQEFVSLLDSLNPGQHTGVIRTPQGFMIFQLIEKRGGNQPLVVEQYHTSHILIRTNEAVSDTDAKNRILQIRDRILRGAKFAEMAKLYSEDGSNVKGGDLGWVNKGDMVPGSKKPCWPCLRAQCIRAGTQPLWLASDPGGCQAQPGCLRRSRTPDHQATAALRKLDQAYLDRVRQLRDSAFVEQRLDDK
jgi:peptidyl-prolyl cis-trans isomerase SurA